MTPPPVMFRGRGQLRGLAGDELAVHEDGELWPAHQLVLVPHELKWRPCPLDLTRAAIPPPRVTVPTALMEDDHTVNDWGFYCCGAHRALLALQNAVGECVTNHVDVQTVAICNGPLQVVGWTSEVCRAISNSEGVFRIRVL